MVKQSTLQLKLLVLFTLYFYKNSFNYKSPLFIVNIDETAPLGEYSLRS